VRRQLNYLRRRSLRRLFSPWYSAPGISHLLI